MLFNENQQATDYRFLEVNPAFEAQINLHEATGKTMRELAPEHEENWFRKYGEVALSGVHQHFEQEAAALGRWYEVYAFRMDMLQDYQIAILFNDITERKRNEERQAFLLKVSDAMRALPNEETIDVLGTSRLAEYLQVERCYLATLYPEQDRVYVGPE